MTKEKNKLSAVEQLDPRQLKFLELWQATGNAYQSAVKAGYSESYAKEISARTPEKIRNAWDELLDRQISDSLLAKRHQELLNKKEKIARNNNKTGKIEVLDTGEIDVGAVSKGLDMAYKLKQRYQGELDDKPQKHLHMHFDFSKLTPEQQKKFAITGEIDEEIQTTGE